MKSVLIIADDLGLYLQEVLEQEGYSVSICKSYGNLEEIYSELARKSYDVVIPTNNSLGPQNILEVVPKIRKRHPKIRVVVLSGYHPPDFVLRLQQSGIDAFFPTPFQVDEVVSKIKELLGAKRLPNSEAV